MTDKCPTCDRAFKGISDYPFVYVAKFERLEIPPRVTFPDRDYKIYVGPASEDINPRPPEEVLDFFREYSIAQEFEHDGYTWHREGKWDSGSYHRTREDAKDIILAQLNPYFDTLEGLVGKEVSTQKVLPSFGETIQGYCRIPETSYHLTLAELGVKREGLMLSRSKLLVPNLETPQPTKKLAFLIAHGGGGHLSIESLFATVGGLAYEGRIIERGYTGVEWDDEIYGVGDLGVE